MLKALFWLGSSRSDIRNFPADATRRSGYELYLVQSGLEPSDWKPMSSVGSGVQEIRVHTGREPSVLYVAKLQEAVYVLHAFEKKARKTQRTTWIWPDRGCESCCRRAALRGKLRSKT
jgi:phage-related protein